MAKTPDDDLPPPGSLSAARVLRHYQPASRASARIRLAPISGDVQALASGDLFGTTSRYRHGTRDRADRATVELALDPRTRMILYKLINKGELEELNGCIATGKEANVYHGVLSPSGSLHRLAGCRDVAVKVFKTSILTFRDRNRYIDGEFRFRRGAMATRNPRKMVRLWAEKEFRNLLRMHTAGIPCPRPLALRQHVLLMSFLGSDGRAAPHLRDPVFLRDTEAVQCAYVEVLSSIRRLYKHAHLVHADLSEYNMMYHDGRCVLFDVGQAVEFDHPRALEFLRRDIAQVHAFFRHQGGLATASARDVFDFVCDPTIEDEDEARHLENLQARATDAGDPEDAVFLGAHIPRTLFDVSPRAFVEDRLAALTAEPGQPDAIYYRRVMGLNRRLTGTTGADDWMNDEVDQAGVKEDIEMMQRALKSFKDNPLLLGHDRDTRSDSDTEDDQDDSDTGGDQDDNDIPSHHGDNRGNDEDWEEEINSKGSNLIEEINPEKINFEENDPNENNDLDESDFISPNTLTTPRIFPKGLNDPGIHEDDFEGLESHEDDFEGLENHEDDFEGLENHEDGSEGLENHEDDSEGLENHEAQPNATPAAHLDLGPTSDLALEIAAPNNAAATSFEKASAFLVDHATSSPLMPSARQRRLTEEQRAERKSNKRAAKTEAAERRLGKIKKHIKKRAHKISRKRR